MSNPQTSAEWKKVADEQIALAKEVGEKERVIGRQLGEVFAEKEKIDSQIRKDATTLRVLGAAVARGEKLEPEAQKRYDLAVSRSESDKAKAAELDAKRISLQSLSAPYTEQRTNAERAAQEAFQKSTQAAESNPDGNRLPAPAGDSTNASASGSPTAVQPDPDTVISAKSQPLISPNTGLPLPSGVEISSSGRPMVTVDLGSNNTPQSNVFVPAPPAPSPEEQQQQQDAEFINIEAQKQASEQLGVVVGGPISPPTGTVRPISSTGVVGSDQPLAGPAQAQQTVSAEPAPGDSLLESERNVIADQKQVDSGPGSGTGDAATQAEADAINTEIELQAQQNREAQSELTREGRRGLSGKVKDTQAQASVQDTVNFNQIPDWRVRLKLAPSANYLYKASPAGILEPLIATDGVVFPYTPSIQMGYTANYDALDVTHSNYKLYQYKNSAVEQLSITADFTAQDTNEALYVLAVIHFFRTITKMFYGKDQNPIAGTPPPLCYLYGLGDFQFNQHPVVISNFSYALPTDVDYIRAGAPTLVAGQSSSGYNTPNNSKTASNTRMQASNVPVGGRTASPNWTTSTNIEPTYIPTKLQLSITALPIVTRKDISDNFSVKEYATGDLMKGTQNARGGIW